MTRIWVTGAPFWSEVGAGLLKRAGFDAQSRPISAEALPVYLRWCKPLRWIGYSSCSLLVLLLSRASVIHVVSPCWGSRYLCWLAHGFGKKVFLHWIGSDVLDPVEGIVAPGQGKKRDWWIRHADAHFADSPALVDALAEIGIHAELFRLLTDTILYEDEMLLPPSHAVLAYWSPGRRRFYGGDLVEQLASEYPEIPFYIMGVNADGEDRPSNLHSLGWVDDPEELYRKTSILIRMPRHDSLSTMVLEALARGRWVIYSHAFPHTEFAETLDDARKALNRCLARTDLNLAGREYVRQTFHPAAESRRLAPIYNNVLAGRR